jgi:hypothetical protein
MWSNKEEAIRAFVGDVDTDGVYRKYKYELSLKDDGDEWWELLLPVWAQNNKVNKYIFNKVVLALEMKDSSVSVEDGKIKLCLYTSVCEPT